MQQMVAICWQAAYLQHMQRMLAICCLAAYMYHMQHILAICWLAAYTEHMAVGALGRLGQPVRLGADRGGDPRNGQKWDPVSYRCHFLVRELEAGHFGVRGLGRRAGPADRGGDPSDGQKLHPVSYRCHFVVRELEACHFGVRGSVRRLGAGGPG